MALAQPWHELACLGDLFIPSSALQGRAVVGMYSDLRADLHTRLHGQCGGGLMSLCSGIPQGPWQERRAQVVVDGYSDSAPAEAAAPRTRVGRAAAASSGHGSCPTPRRVSPTSSHSHACPSSVLYGPRGPSLQPTRGSGHLSTTCPGFWLCLQPGGG